MHRVTSSDGVHSGVMKVLLHQPMSLCDQSDFVTEALALSRLQHPCLTSVLSCGLNPMNVVWQAAVGCSAAEHMDKYPPHPPQRAPFIVECKPLPAASWRAAPTTPTSHSPLAWSGKSHAALPLSAHCP